MTTPHRHIPGRFVVPLLLAALPVAAAGALLVGDSRVAPRRVVAALWPGSAEAPSDEVAARIVLDIRLPRIALAICIGAGMGLAGLAAQTLFRNPLASPYVLGVSNGAAVGAAVAMLAGNWLGRAGVPLLSVAGGLAVSALVYALARRSSRFGHTLLLAGIALGAFCSALTAVALYLAGERLQTLVFWLMGGLWQATWHDVLLMLPATTLALVALTVLAPALNVALFGERSAGDLGVNVRRLQSTLLIVIAVTTALGVAVSGVIGFVGLIVPHLLRLLCGADHRRLVPATAAGGGLLLLCADTLARTAAAPAEVPVGIVTALLGAPVFLVVLLRRVERGNWL